ncbi:MAG: tyrosine recombinase XerC [Oscillospiraceae bacterium]|nr:tyrosine recombinase XerC [Oscillospiraceae bacterium]
MNIDKTQNPKFLNDYLMYISVTKGLSPRTVNEYYFDIRLFLRYLVMMDKGLEDSKVLEELSIKDITIERINKVKLEDFYNYLYYIQRERDNNARARGRKVSALKSLFKYLYKNVGLIDQNPADKIELPVQKKSLPKYLQLDECQKLLDSLNRNSSARDYCIIVLFLNCGMRLSELVGIDITDISFEEMRMRVLGKGNKERYVFLNKACISAINAYLAVRKKSETDCKALFLSSRGTRISKRRVQQIVETALKDADLGNRGLSTHKLRHTAATLMYTYGGADMMTLKEILGHESTSTTEIYTHISNDSLRNIAESMPFEPKKDK